MSPTVDEAAVDRSQDAVVVLRVSSRRFVVPKQPCFFGTGAKTRIGTDHRSSKGTHAHKSGLFLLTIQLLKCEMVTVRGSLLVEEAG